MKKIAIIMGSDSDFPVVKAAADTLQELEIPFEVHVYSAHRTPEAVQVFVSAARQNGFGVIIAAAGKAAHLAGVLAAGTTLPVITYAPENRNTDNASVCILECFHSRKNAA